MALEDELGKGKEAIEENIKAFQDLAAEAQQTFISIAASIENSIKELKKQKNATGEVAANNKDITASLNAQQTSNTKLVSLAEKLSKFSKKDLD